VADFLNPEFVALGPSHGYGSYEHKLFMRVTVLIADLFIYTPAVGWCFHVRQSSLQNSARNSWDGNTYSVCIVKEEKDFTSNAVAVYLTLIYPGFMLIDHDHFQYSGISLGSTLAAVAAII
jgi:alpha-1,3-glucosyltransferase